LVDLEDTKTDHPVIISTAISGDGKRVVSATIDGAAYLWELSSGRIKAKLSGREGRLVSASFSPEGKRIVTASEDGTARLWDANSGTQLIALEGHKAALTSAAFSKDGARLVTASKDGTARVWDVVYGTAIATFQGHDATVTAAAFSPDGERVATVSKEDRTARIWDLTDVRVIAVIEQVNDAEFTPDSMHIVAEDHSETVRFLDYNGSALAQFSEFIVSSSPDMSIVATASSDHVVNIRDASGKLLGTVDDDRGSLVFTPPYLAFGSHGAHIIVVSKDKTATLRETATWRPIASLSNNKASVSFAVFNPDESRAVVKYDDNTVVLCDTILGNAVSRLAVGGKVLSAAFSPDGARIATLSADKAVEIWDGTTGKSITKLQGVLQTASFAFSPDHSKMTLVLLKDPESQLTESVTKSGLPDLRTVKPSESEVQLWDLETGQMIAALGSLEDQGSATFSPDGSRVVTHPSGTGTTSLWDAHSGRLVKTLTRNTSLFSVKFNRDGTRMLTEEWDETSSGKLWDPISGRLISLLKVDAGGRTAFSPDGTRIVTTGNDGYARVWDAVSGRQIALLEGHKERVWTAAFSSDGRRILTGSDDNTVRIWDVSGIPKGNILQVTCSLLRMREDPVSLEGVTDYPLTFDRPICVTDPPSPDLLREAGAKTAQ
jgi:WD40 repeat protein